MSEQSPHDNPNWLLDREAGAGWRTQGMDEILRFAIDHRERVLDEIVHYKSEFGGVPDHMQVEFEEAVRRVDARKSQLDINDPPPLSPEDM